VPLNTVFAARRDAAARWSVVLPSFEAILAGGSPSVEVLEEVKRAARAAINDESAAIPVQIAAALYFASIALALVRHGRRISKSDDNVLRYGFQKMLDQPWLGKRLTQLFNDALKLLAKPAEPDGKLPAADGDS
jgi:hypothetical protein